MGRNSFNWASSKLWTCGCAADSILTIGVCVPGCKSSYGKFVVGDEAHPSLIKALGMLGLGRSRVVRVRVDDQGRMRAGEIPPLSGLDR